MLWQVLAKLLGLVPSSKLHVLGLLLGSFVGRVLRIRRKHALTALKRAKIADPLHVVDLVYNSLATNVFELLWSEGKTASELLEMLRVTPEQWARVEELREKGKGLVIATAHCGNWDLLGCAVASKLPLAVVTRHLKWTSADRHWQQTRANRAISLLDSDGSFSRSLALLRSGQTVAYLIDQRPLRAHGTATCDFLGAKVHVDLSFAMLSQRSQAPVLLVCDSREADGTHRAHILDIAEPPARPSRQWITQTACRFTRSLDAFVRQHPEQWLWLHRRWVLDNEPGHDDALG
jgi:KDO2-lipid IV(A) lauroyltransferase